MIGPLTRMNHPNHPGSYTGLPLWDQFGLILGIIFLMFFWSGFLMALASIWAPKTPPKWDPKEGQNPKLKIIDFASMYCTLATFKGVENRHFLKFCLIPFWDGFWSQFWWFWLTFGVPFGDNFGNLLDPIFASIFRPQKTSKNGEAPLQSPPSAGHALSPPRTPPP